MSTQSTGLSRDEKKRRQRKVADPAEGVPPDVIVELERKAAASPRDLSYPGEERLIFKGELLERVGLSFANVWKMMREGTFPRARVAGGRSAWLSSEVDAWLRQLPIRKLKGDE